MLADQDFEDMFLADTRARLGRVTLRGHDHIASIPYLSAFSQFYCFRFLPLLWYFQKMRNEECMEKL